MLTRAQRAAAFAPGHVTGLFEIHDKASEIERRGSRGAGVCLDLGVISVVEVEPADAQEIEVYVNKSPSEAVVTRTAISKLLQEAALDGKIAVDRDAPRGERAKARVRVHADVQLPVSQGFGMSAAGALSATMALSRALRMGRTEAVKAAHAADVEHKAGLGDVVAQTHGGVEIRLAPGLPPYGALGSILGMGDVVLCVVGKPLETRAILGNAARRKAINETGRRWLDALIAEPSLESFFAASRQFATDAGLMTPEIEAAVGACAPYGHASMSMLGNSVFAMGRTRDLEDVLQDYGEVITTRVAETPAHVLQVETPDAAPR